MKMKHVPASKKQRSKGGKGKMKHMYKVGNNRGGKVKRSHNRGNY